MSKKLAKFEDYVAPWEDPEGGDDQDIDKPKLKKYLFGVLGDKQRLQETVDSVTTERDTLKTAADEVARKGETDTQRLERENKELQDKLAAKPEGKSKRELQLEVALAKGLNAHQAQRLIGETVEELTADADELIKSFGGTGKVDDENQGEEEEGGLRRTPKATVNPGDPNPEEGSGSIDMSKLDEILPRTNSL